MEEYIRKFEGQYGVKWHQTNSERESSYRSFMIEKQQDLLEDPNSSKNILGPMANLYCKTGVNPSFNQSMSSTQGLTRGARTRPAQSRQRSDTMTKGQTLQNYVFEDIKVGPEE